jgi:hypothetical protein
MTKIAIKLKRAVRAAGRNSRRLIYPLRPTTPGASLAKRLKRFGLRLSGYALVVGAAYLTVRADMAVPDKVILVLGLTALVIRVISGLFFAAALVMLVYVPILQATGHVEASNSFGAYAFYCLCFGALSALLQLPRDQGTESNR